MTAIHRQRKDTVMTVMEKDNSMLTERKIAEFEQCLKAEEHQKATVEKYLRNIRFFASWLQGGEITREAVPSSTFSALFIDFFDAVSATLIAIFDFTAFLNHCDCRSVQVYCHEKGKRLYCM